MEGGDRHLPKKQLTAMDLERQNNPVVIYHLQNKFVLEIGLLSIADFFFQLFHSPFARIRKSCKIFYHITQTTICRGN